MPWQTRRPIWTPEFKWAWNNDKWVLEPLTDDTHGWRATVEKVDGEFWSIFAAGKSLSQRMTPVPNTANFLVLRPQGHPRHAPIAIPDLREAFRQVGDSHRIVRLGVVLPPQPLKPKMQRSCNLAKAALL